MNARRAASLILVSVLAAAAGNATAAEAPSLGQRMWQNAQKKDALPQGQTCRVLEKFRLVAIHPGFSPDATALAAVFGFEVPLRLSDPMGGSPRMIPLMVLAQLAEKDGLIKDPDSEDRGGEEAQDRFGEFFRRKFGEVDLRGQTAVMHLLDEKENKGTLGMMDAAVIEPYFKAAPRPTLEAVLRQIAADNLLKADLRTEAKPTWDAVVKAIDTGLPVILLGKEGPTVAIGYYQDAKEQVLFLYDPVKAKPWNTTSADRRKDLPPLDLRGIDDPKFLEYLKKEGEKKITLDYEVNLSRDLPPGLDAAAWADVQDRPAIFSGENKWPPEVEAVYKELKVFMATKDPPDDQLPGTPEEKALKEIRLMGGRATRDETLPGKPVVAVAFGLGRIRETTLRKLQGLPNLKRLELGAASITDAGAKELGALKGLQELSVNGISDAGLKELKGLKGLTKLRCATCSGITDAGLKELKDLSGLQELDLGHTGVTDAGLKELKGLTELRTLSLNALPITDEGLKELRDLKNLRDLWLGQAKITDAGLANLEGLVELRKLSLQFTKVTSAGMKSIAKLKNLESLDLTAVQVGDAGVKELRGLQNLRVLCLDSAGITDAAVPDLKELKNLQELYIQNDKISDAGVKELKQALPKTHIAPPRMPWESDNSGK